MALFHSHFFSEALGMQVSAEVVIPQAASSLEIGVGSAAARKTWPCLWLLHGLSDDHTIWLPRTSIERYASEMGVAVVMPNCERGFYTDMAYGQAWWTYLSEELPALMRGFFPLSERREDNAVAGLSMGGYGAAKWLLRKPEAFIGGVSLSGVMDIVEELRMAQTNPRGELLHETLGLVFGDRNVAGSPDDLFALVAQHGTKGPPLLQICGTEDFLYADNLRFRDHVLAHHYPLTYRELPGAHTWGFWDQEIQTSLDWLKSLGFWGEG
jgi:S-formylglutathione hydrolase FrmB